MGSAEAIKEIVAQASVTDPAKAIKTILAQAQVEQAQTPEAGDGSPASSTEVFVSSHAGSQTVDSGTTEVASPPVTTPDDAEDVAQSLDYIDITRAPIGPVIVQSSYSEITSSNSVFEMQYNSVIGVYQNIGISNAETSPATSSDVSEQTNSSSFIQFGRSIAKSSVNIGFSVDDLGAMTYDGNTFSAVNPQGDLGINLQIDFDAAQGTDNEGASCTAGGLCFNITGLDAGQAQSIMEGFQEATDGTNNANDPTSSLYLNTENFSGMDVAFSAVICEQ